MHCKYTCYFSTPIFTSAFTYHKFQESTIISVCAQEQIIECHHTTKSIGIIQSIGIITTHAVIETLQLERVRDIQKVQSIRLSEMGMFGLRILPQMLKVKDCTPCLYLEKQEREFRSNHLQVRVRLFFSSMISLKTCKIQEIIKCVGSGVIEYETM